jgi:hypothetical protein
MADLRAVPYRYSKHWQTPTEVNLEQAADCKGKAVALYAQMRRSGAKNVRIVIGKHHIYDLATHAWLEWETAAGSYMLDPTFNEMPVKATELDPMTYVPFFAYDGEYKYRVANGGLLAPTTRVAKGYSNHVSTPAAATANTFAQPRLAAMQSRPVSAETTQYLDTQHSWPNDQKIPVSNAARPGPAKAAMVHPKTQSLVSPHPIAATSQNLTRRVRRHSTASGNRRKRRTLQSGAAHRQASKLKAAATPES